MIPSTGGMSPGQATDLLEEAGFQVADGGMRDTGYPRGTVAYTNPAGGSQAPSGSVVTLYISTGQRNVAPQPDPTPSAPPRPDDLSRPPDRARDRAEDYRVRRTGRDTPTGADQTG